MANGTIPIFLLRDNQPYYTYNNKKAPVMGAFFNIKVIGLLFISDVEVRSSIELMLFRSTLNAITTFIE